MRTYSQFAQLLLANEADGELNKARSSLADGINTTKQNLDKTVSDAAATAEQTKAAAANVFENTKNIAAGALNAGAKAAENAVDQQLKVRTQTFCIIINTVVGHILISATAYGISWKIF